jgi:fatty-acid desaturase
VLLEPTYGYTRDGVNPYRPTAREALAELFDCINCVGRPERRLITLVFICHAANAFAFLIYLLAFASLQTVAFVALCVPFIGTVYNTFWFHRFCSHAAFKFSKSWYSMPFLWTAPLLWREESYAVPHRIHHRISDQPGDPYGPHLGYLGSYLGIESSQKYNVDMSETQYAIICRSVQHIGFPMNDIHQFRKTGSIEQVPHLLTRMLFQQLFWTTLWGSIGGLPYVMAWYSAVFLSAFLTRDFNWRGHRGPGDREKKKGWEFDTRSQALNTHFYGYIASEWHDNHHRYPTSANLGFLKGQPDLTFVLVRGMHRLGLISKYADAYPRFKKDCLDQAAG